MGIRAILFISVTFFVVSARADVPAEHDLIVTGDLSLSYQHITTSAGDGSIDIFRVSPTLDYVIAKGLTFGAALLYQHLGATDQTSRDDFGIIPRVGYVAQIGPSAFVWPRFGIGYVRGLPDVSNLATSSGALSINRVELQLDVLLCYSPVPHFFIGGGPVFHTDLSSSVSSDNGGISGDVGKLTAFGISTVVGGSF